MGPYSQMVCYGYVVVSGQGPVLRAHGFDLGYTKNLELHVNLWFLCGTYLVALWVDERVAVFLGGLI